jgi:hypothetical protein
MSSNQIATKTPYNFVGIRIKNVALPVEHGGWGFVLEPIVLGLAVAPSLPGLIFAIAVLGAFLSRHPLKLIVTDLRNGRRYPRTIIAERFVILYGSTFLLGTLAAIKMSASYVFLIPVLIAVPFVAVQLFFDFTGKSRALLPELSGSSAISAVASSIAILGGCSIEIASALWLVLTARVIPTILYVRSRLEILHGKSVSFTLPLSFHFVALAIVIWLAYSNLVTILSVLAMLILLLRALFGFLKSNISTTAKQIGISEFFYGAVLVLALVIGYHAGF